MTTSKSEMEFIYEKYLKRDDRSKVINGNQFYRIVYAHHFDTPKLQDYLEMIIPWEYIKSIKADEVVTADTIWIDENGNRFQVLSSAFMRFSGDIPEWYLQCGVFSVRWIDTPAIGNYIGIKK